MKALITGATSPIGEAIARRLKAEGHHLILHAHTNRTRAESLAAELQAHPLIADLTNPQATAEALAQHATPPIQIVVHNAGTHDDVPMAGMSEPQWRGPIDTSLTGFYAVLRPLLLPMMATRHGRIVAVSSVSALMGNRGQVAYAAAKAGLIGAVKSLARELATRGVTVNAVAPGLIASPATAALDPAAIAALVPMHRQGRPEEVADLIAFLASPQAGYITGQAISINGGMA